ncbi:Uncharacterised protein [Candidatus Gugararchaeum adminiculabundum]|nr:Uncharacterised protein [Candidatus Gugararchaeum adminiculabundum]
MAEKSFFLEFFGDTPFYRVIDFLLEHRLEDFTKTEIAKQSDVSWATLYNHWDRLEEFNMVKVTRKVGNVSLYQLNQQEPIVKQLMQMELMLIKEHADKAEEKMKVKAIAKRRQ